MDLFLSFINPNRSTIFRHLRNAKISRPQKTESKQECYDKCHKQAALSIMKGRFFYEKAWL
jgi:hypothetical protein